MFLIVGILSVGSIFIGLTMRDLLTDDIANILFFGGVIVGCCNVIVAFFKK